MYHKVSTMVEVCHNCGTRKKGLVVVESEVDELHLPASK